MTQCADNCYIWDVRVCKTCSGTDCCRIRIGQFVGRVAGYEVGIIDEGCFRAGSDAVLEQWVTPLRKFFLQLLQFKVTDGWLFLDNRLLLFQFLLFYTFFGSFLHSFTHPRTPPSESAPVSASSRLPFTRLLKAPPFKSCMFPYCVFFPWLYLPLVHSHLFPFSMPLRKSHLNGNCFLTLCWFTENIFPYIRVSLNNHPLKDRHSLHPSVLRSSLCLYQCHFHAPLSSWRWR